MSTSTDIKPWHRLLFGALLTVLGPMLGLLISTIIDTVAFGTASNVAPSARAQHVANGLDLASYSVVGGLVLGAVGLASLLFSLPSVLRAKTCR